MGANVAQTLITSMVSDPERLLGQWFEHSLSPRNTSLQSTLSILVYTVLHTQARLQIKLMDPVRLKGCIHIFDDTNFSIDISSLTPDELKCVAILVGARPDAYFSNIHSSASTNTQIFSKSKQELHIEKCHRIQLIEQSCYHVLYFCQSMCGQNVLQVKDLLLSILLNTVQQFFDQDVWNVYMNVKSMRVSKVREHIYDSPTSPRIHDCVKSGSPSSRRAKYRNSEPRNQFLGDDWFSKSYIT